MKDINANDLADNSVLDCDLCIIGGGAAGLSIAKEFENTEHKVILLESGENAFNEKTQALYDFENIGHPVRALQGYISRNRYLGGSTNSWHGRSAPFSEQDFKVRSWIPLSGWPIERRSLDEFYERACKILKLPDYHHFESVDLSRFTADYRPEIFEQGNLLGQVYLYSKKSPTNMKVAYHSDLVKSSNVQICLNANVTNLQISDDKKQIDIAHVKTLTGKKHTVKAKKFILACGGWENARILMMSNDRVPEGLGNEFGNVGKYYMEHPKIVAGKVFPTTQFLRSQLLYWQKKLDNTGNIRLTFRLHEKELEELRLPNHCIELKFPVGFQDSVASSEALLRKLGCSKNTIHKLIRLSPRIFRVLEKLERIMFNLPLNFDHVDIFNHLEQMPNRDSYLALSEDEDELGCPKLKVNFKITEQDKTSIIRFQKAVAEKFESLGLGKVEVNFPLPTEEWTNMTDSSHHMGTTRMSDDKTTGVVDKDCKVFDIDNLYIAGSSIFPTGGPVNPTLNLVTIAIRLADHLKKKLATS